MLRAAQSATLDVRTTPRVHAGLTERGSVKSQRGAEWVHSRRWGGHVLGSCVGRLSDAAASTVFAFATSLTFSTRQNAAPFALEPYT